METDTVKAKLRSAGVPRETFATTLVKEKRPELRQYIEGREFESKSILYISPHSEELSFYLVAKEMVLSGNSVFCCRLVDIHTALFKDTEEADTLATALNKASFIAIDGFYDAGGRSEAFMSPYETQYFISWFIRHHQNGKGFILLGNTDLSFTVNWWPSSFISYITKRCVTYSKAGK